MIQTAPDWEKDRNELREKLSGATDMLKGSETAPCGRCALVDLVKHGFGETSPADWAELAMNRAMLKRTKRPHLLPHLAVTFAEAMQEAREDAARRIADAKA